MGADGIFVQLIHDCFAQCWNLVVVFFFFGSLQGNEFSLTKEQETCVVGIMLSVTSVKLVLVVYCRSFINEIVKSYPQDHFFDVITNVIGLVAALLANCFKYWIDPVGAMIATKITKIVKHLWKHPSK